MKQKNKILIFLLVCIFFIFPFGQIPKIAISADVKISLVDILVGLFALVSLFLLKRIKKKPLLQKSGLLFILAAVISLIVNVFFQPADKLIIGLFYLVRFSLYALFYVQLLKFIDLNKQAHIKFIDKGLLLSGFFVAIFGLIQYLLYPDLRNLMYLGWDPHYYRLFSTFFDPNFTGIILVLTLFHLIFLFKNNKKTSYLGYIAFFIISAAIFLTRSRSAFLSLLTGVAALGVIAQSYRKFIFGLIIIFILISFLPTPPVDVFDLLRVTSSVARVENWRQSIETSLKSPFFGSGFGITRFSDSSFLYVLVGTGFLGLISYLYIWKKLLYFGIKKREVLVVSTVLFVGSWFNNILFYPWILLWFILFLTRNEVYGS